MMTMRVPTMGWQAPALVSVSAEGVERKEYWRRAEEDLGAGVLGCLGLSNMVAAANKHQTWAPQSPGASGALALPLASLGAEGERERAEDDSEEGGNNSRSKLLHVFVRVD